MKKIGIMSMQRIKNYGSFWQAYGLRKVLEDIEDCMVEYVDYVPGIVIEKENGLEKKPNFDFKRKILKKIYGGVFYIKYNYIWLPKYLNIKKKRNYSKDYDLTIIGSDEVFNCTQSGDTVGFSTDLFGKGRKNVVSYAASFGFTTLDRLNKYGLTKQVGKMLNNFKRISVRDNNSKKIVESISNIVPESNLDPALISNINSLALPKVRLQNYIIVYAYTGRINKEEQKIIKTFAKKKNKKIISLGYYHDFVDKVIVCNPFKVLSYFKNADYIITDTFHGTIFSIIFEKKFVTIIRKSNKEKLLDLLEKFELTSRCIANNENFEKKLSKEIDYAKINAMMEKEKKKTKQYLLKCIRG